MTHPALRQVEHELALYKRIWRGSITTSFLTPVLFLGAMGLGIGESVDQARGGAGPPSLGGVPYLTFLVPGLLASTAMQMGASESLWPVQGGFAWQRFFHAAAATPLRPLDILLGWLVWIVARVHMAATFFLVVAAALGAVESWLAVLAIPAAALTGLAFAAPLTAFTATRQGDTAFPLILRFGVMPLFLFSGAFLPLEQLPAGLRPVAWATPLWHGVDLCRSLTLGSVEPGAALLHVVVLAAFAIAGIAWGSRTFTRRLTR